MYDAGKIITFGGATAYADADATTRSVLITLVGTTVTTKTVGSMGRARSFGTGVALPDGKVLAIGGQARPVPFSDATAAFETGALQPKRCS
jgi:galactose oxidase